MRHFGGYVDVNQIQLLSESGQDRLEELHEQHQAKIAVPPERIQEALNMVIQAAIHSAVEELAAACTPDQSDAVFAYLAMALDQPTATAVTRISRPSAFGNGSDRPLAAEHKALRRAFTRLAALESVRIHGETRSLQPWKNVRSISVANVSDLDMGLEVVVLCPACEAAGRFRLQTLNASRPAALYRGAFKCGSCGHQHDTTGSTGASVRGGGRSLCACIFCTGLEQGLLSEIQQLLAESAPKTMERYRQLVDRLAAHQTLPPNEDDMRRDWVLHKNDLNKALRALVELKPKDGPDFLECLHKYTARHTGRPKDILESAVRHKVVYRLTVRRIKHCSSYEDILAATSPVVWCSESRGMADDERAEQALQALASWLCGGTEPRSGRCVLCVDDRSIYVTYQSMRVDLGSTHGWLHQDLSAGVENSLVLNPYFLGVHASGDQTAVASAVRVFRSNTECNAFHRIRGERPDSIVVPNYPMKRVVDLGPLKPHFSSEDWTYLRDCELDLVVCNEAGYVAYVEEVQRGDHHNDPEWVRKDALKRQALSLAGIPLRESF